MKTTAFDFNEFRTKGEAFFRDLIAEMSKLGIQADALKADHLCFRVSRLEEYEAYKRDLSSHGLILAESLVNGRPITTFLLNEPFQTKHHIIQLVELPAPKPAAPYDLGFEHAEFVINESFDRFTARHSHLSFAESGCKSLNPELCLQLTGRQAKFHHLTLERVIEIEKAEIKDVIFDLDGTLIKSRENIYEINRIVFSRATGREVSLDESIEKFHPEFSKLFDAFVVTCPLKKKEAIAAWGLVAEQFSYELFDGVFDLLDALAQLDFRLHLWTARDESSARRILKHHGIEKYFSTLSFATDVDSKPNSNSLRFDWRSAGKNQIVVIGDSSSDVFGAKNIGAISIGALWDSHAQKKSLIGAGVEILFNEPGELKEWISSKMAACARTSTSKGSVFQ